jgi:hypothetical protein
MARRAWRPTGVPPTIIAYLVATGVLVACVAAGVAWLFLLPEPIESVTVLIGLTVGFGGLGLLVFSWSTRKRGIAQLREVGLRAVAAAEQSTGQLEPTLNASDSERGAPETGTDDLRELFVFLGDIEQDLFLVGEFGQAHEVGNARREVGRRLVSLRSSGNEATNAIGTTSDVD